MNYSELRDEFFARGTDYLEEDAAGIARADRWLNQAYREILNLHAWPFLEAEATGSAGTGSVVIPDLRKIRMVVDTAQSGFPLSRANIEDLVDEEAVLTSTGTPEVYYVVAGSTVQAYPVGGTIKVYYYKRVAALTGTDTPIFRDEYHDLIVDRAMIKAYKDSDNFEAGAALRQEYEAGVAGMAEDYQLVAREVTYITPTGTDGG